MTDWLMIAVGVVLTVGTALFVAGEFSLVALDPSTVETRAATGDKRATTVRRALGRLSTLLSGAQVGITLTTVLLGYTMQAAPANLAFGADPPVTAVRNRSASKAYTPELISVRARWSSVASFSSTMPMTSPSAVRTMRP